MSLKTESNEVKNITVKQAIQTIHKQQVVLKKDFDDTSNQLNSILYFLSKQYRIDPMKFTIEEIDRHFQNPDTPSPSPDDHQSKKRKISEVESKPDEDNSDPKMIKSLKKRVKELEKTVKAKQEALDKLEKSNAESSKASYEANRKADAVQISFSTNQIVIDKRLKDLETLTKKESAEEENSISDRVTKNEADIKNLSWSVNLNTIDQKIKASTLSKDEIENLVKETLKTHQPASSSTPENIDAKIQTALDNFAKDSGKNLLLEKVVETVDVSIPVSIEQLQPPVTQIIEPIIKSYHESNVSKFSQLIKAEVVQSMTAYEQKLTKANAEKIEKINKANSEKIEKLSKDSAEKIEKIGKDNAEKIEASKKNLEMQLQLMVNKSKETDESLKIDDDELENLKTEVNNKLSEFGTKIEEIRNELKSNIVNKDALLNGNKALLLKINALG